MLCKDKIISIFCLIDDILQGIQHVEDVRRQVSDSEIILTAIVSSTSFYGNHCSAIKFMKQYGFIPNMLDKSRFNRRLHKVGKLLYELFEIVSSYFKDFCCEMHYIIDSFPVSVCNNMRITNCKIVSGNKWRGYTASMRSYFYGVKVQLLTTKDGIPIAFHFTPGKTGDAKALGKMIDKLHVEASLYGDSAYTDYGLEDIALNKKCILLKIQRKSNAKRIDTLEQKNEKLKMRKRVETTISDIKKMFPRTIHAVTLEGFLIKLTLFVFGLQLNKAIN
ncbi:IS982 family transposase [Flavobacterium sp. NG2]|uniref:IS982 family transposase n=1 Tax=Flavobacterium sp. NG2 TaxID=3097547 RepID=UPI002A83EB98|nr:IS982 family transposase [Flavobacterium sp. NG2]WPR70691.1 IS982 family transposase [Flavobacterium sp. NG2]WPR71741.1 IS982 family transposase [Flavobacterium sp. NG2]WPR72102.1 IS982 family transposase [Flavobacterium sp. NG2]WPR72186.1 IS982 family transposase [Flavobacterium sp. NG2]WPR72452.1 IS982 family transposase [Flavobacterium sp. NG2]